VRCGHRFSCGQAAADARENGARRALTYDAEARLVQGQRISTTTTLSTFVYDGDGNRVRATQNAVTTLYIGDYAEWRPAASNKLLKYYYSARAYRHGGGQHRLLPVRGSPGLHQADN
jgi:hypothetical protein